MKGAVPTHRSLLSGVVAAAALAPWPRGASAATVTTFPLPTPDEGVADITVGPDGNLWYASEDAYKWAASRRVAGSASGTPRGTRTARTTRGPTRSSRATTARCTR